MKKWELELYGKYFDLVKSSKKIVEGRAPSKHIDYGQMSLGDNLTFTNLDTGEKVTVTVVKIVHYWTVEEMLESEGLKNCLPGAKIIQEGVEIYYAIPSYKERIWEGGIYAIRFGNVRQGEKVILEIDKEKFTEHIKRICRSNIRKPCKICLVCPFREYVLEIMKENGWKLPG